MPVLDSLRLHEFELTLMDLEMVHCNIPSIKSLALSDIDLLSGPAPYNVIPAMLIAKKYPSVNKPNYTDKAVRDKNSDYVKDVYNKGILPWYQNNGSQIDTFTFDNYCDGLDAFRKFDRIGIKLKRLRIHPLLEVPPLFIEELAQSEQSKYIQNLTLENLDLAPLEMMINMEVLTSLILNFRDNYGEYGKESKTTLNFSQLIEACPATLTNLTIGNAKLTFNESASNITSIRSLKLSDVDTKPGAAIMGANFPKLSILRVYAFIEGNLTISLPSNHLKEADIHTNYPQNKRYSLSINTMYEGRPQRTVSWPIPDHGSKGEMYCSDKSDSELKSDWVVDFTCASVEKLTYSIIKNEDEHDDDDDDDDDEYL